MREHGKVPILTWTLLVIAGGAPVIAADENIIPQHVCNLAWDSPSTGANGSMPLGNGEVGLNLWMEKNGDLRSASSR